MKKKIPHHVKATRVLPTGPLLHRSDGEIDGRSLRRTGRHVLFAARVTETFPDAVKEIAAREKRTVGAVLEDALRSYRGPTKPKQPVPR